MSDKLLFTCRVCGAEVGSHGFTTNALGEEIGVQGVCSEHCEDHDYEYDRDRRGHFCLHCDEEREWEPSEDGVCIFGGGYDPGEPLGTPISELAGRPDGTREGQAKYERFCAIAASWGYP
jgi:hypothetical protein